ncbi:leucine-rich repeat protein [uncultured Porphyromonas sp.]|uniref:leucine-rich repeat protein n=1 Tax=uncultured Porphyromonas sp. TaxID=159274 RepID=UPI0026184A16|nr:leucine-rich repeat protein [uncultured Porphyromonas sp.]
MRPFGSKSDGKTLQLVQRGTDKRIPVELIKQPSGEVLDPAELEGLHVMVSSESEMEIATIPYTIEDKKLVVEVTADVSRHLGLGVYTMTATGRIPDEAYADGYHDYEIVVALCNVTKYGSNETPVKVTANVLDGLKGKDGLNNYQLAVKHGYQGTEEQFAKDIIPKSNYERAKELQGFQGTEVDYLVSLHGAPGESIYDIAVRRGFVGSEQAYLDSQKGADGKDAYQLYLETTTDNPKMTEAQYAAINATTTQYLYRINKGKDAPMNEQTLSADQLMELDSHRRNIIKALRAKGAQVSDDDGLEALEAKIAALSYSRITVIREQQFSGWMDEVYPPMVVSETFRPVSLKNMFAQNPRLSQLPVVEGVEKALYIDSYAQRCPSLRSVELPDLREVKTATTMFDGCTSMTKATIGALPALTNATWLFSSCQALVSATVGSAPKLEVAQGLFNSCTSLQSVTLDLSGGLITNASLLFGSCDKLRIVTGDIDLSRATNVNSAFSGCASLEELRVKGLKVDLDLSACANLSVESVKYLVDNLQQVTGKSITLASAWQTAHPTEARAYAQKATAKGFALTFR